MEECIKSLLKIVEEKQIQSFSVPSLCTGSFGFPTQLFAEIFFKELMRYQLLTLFSLSLLRYLESIDGVYNQTCIQEIHLCAEDYNLVGVFVEELQKQTANHVQVPPLGNTIQQNDNNTTYNSINSLLCTKDAEQRHVPEDSTIIHLGQSILVRQGEMIRGILVPKVTQKNIKLKKQGTNLYLKYDSKADLKRGNTDYDLVNRIGGNSKNLSNQLSFQSNDSSEQRGSRKQSKTISIPEEQQELEEDETTKKKRVTSIQLVDTNSFNNHANKTMQPKRSNKKGSDEEDSDTEICEIDSQNTSGQRQSQDIFKTARKEFDTTNAYEELSKTDAKAVQKFAKTKQSQQSGDEFKTFTEDTENFGTCYESLNQQSRDKSEDFYTMDNNSDMFQEFENSTDKKDMQEPLLQDKEELSRVSEKNQGLEQSGLVQKISSNQYKPPTNEKLSLLQINNKMEEEN